MSSKTVTQWYAWWQEHIGISSIPIENLHSVMIAWMVDNHLINMYLEEAKALYEYSSKANGLIVDIGSHRGGSAILMSLSNLNNSTRVYSFDIVQDTNNFIRAKHFGCSCNFISMGSHEAGKIWDKGKIDLLLIDGCHLHEHCYQDMDIWSQHLNNGCYMLVHDYPVGKKQLQKCISRERKLIRKLRRGKNAQLGNNTYCNVYVAVKIFLKHHCFEEIGQIERLKILRKNRCD